MGAQGQCKILPTGQHILKKHLEEATENNHEINGGLNQMILKLQNNTKDKGIQLFIRNLFVANIMSFPDRLRDPF